MRKHAIQTTTLFPRNTEAARRLICSPPPVGIKTALWEVEIGHITEGHMALDIFIDGVFKELAHLIDSVRQSEGFRFQCVGSGDEQHKCPICKGVLRRIRRKDGGYLWASQDQGCKKTFDYAKGKPMLTKETQKVRH